MKLLAFDLETTGLEAEKDRIVEFCFLSVDKELNVTGRFASLVNPGIPIPPESTEVTGISDEDVARYPLFRTFAARIQSLVDGSVLVAHNGSFDLGFLNAELRRAGLPGVKASHPLVDTLAIERKLNSNKLEDCYKRYNNGMGFEDAHRAEADVRATIAILQGQLNRLSLAAPEERALVPIDSLDELQTTVRNLIGEEDKKYLDHARKFYEDASGVAYFNFGKHRGEPVASHTDYLEWMNLQDFPHDTKHAAMQLWRKSCSDSVKNGAHSKKSKSSDTSPTKSLSQSAAEQT